jgi:hypothetical protein
MSDTLPKFSSSTSATVSKKFEPDWFQYDNLLQPCRHLTSECASLRVSALVVIDTSVVTAHTVPNGLSVFISVHQTTSTPKL